MSGEGIQDYHDRDGAERLWCFVLAGKQRAIGAILRELKRGGRVCFLHNDVDVERYLTLARYPRHTSQIAHSQARRLRWKRVTADLSAALLVLLCTTIGQTGIDIDRDAIIIHRAVGFGLAQLHHQLREAIQRSHHRAYATSRRPKASITRTRKAANLQESRGSREAASTSRCMT